MKLIYPFIEKTNYGYKQLKLNDVSLKKFRTFKNISKWIQNEYYFNNLLKIDYCDFLNPNIINETKFFEINISSSTFTENNNNNNTFLIISNDTIEIEKNMFPSLHSYDLSTNKIYEKIIIDNITFLLINDVLCIEIDNSYTNYNHIFNLINIHLLET